MSCLRSTPLLCMLLLAAVLGAPAPARAAIFCVDGSMVKLGDALQAAAQNGVDDEIRLRADQAYASPNAAVMTTTLAGSQSLKISGGWTGASGACTTQVHDPWRTSLIASAQTVRIAYFTVDAGATGTLRLENVFLFGGAFASPEAGHCLNVGSFSAQATIEIERVVFSRCSSPGYGAASIVGGGGPIHFRGNVVVASQMNNASSARAMRIYAPSGNVYVSNNTIARNLGNPATEGGLRLEGNALFHLTNNVIHTNIGLSDLTVTADTSLIRNHLGVVAGNAEGIVIGNTSGDPGFDGPASIEPRADSPLRNSGVSLPFGGIAERDIRGMPRDLEGAVDRGAYEYVPPIFADGFED